MAGARMASASGEGPLYKLVPRRPAHAWHSGFSTASSRVCLELVKRPHTYINIHHHHRHATTMTVTLVPRRPASEIDIKHT